MEQHILIVDDEPNILNSLRRLLEEEDYIVYQAISGQEGIKIMDANPQIGVILSDQRMPNMTGTEFLKQIKITHSNVVRMILSGYSELSTITQAINEGSIFKFLTKPWKDDLILKNIQEAFQYFELAEENRLLTIKLQESNALLEKFNAELEKAVEDKTRRLRLHIASLNIYQDAMEHLPFAIIGMDDSLTVALENKAARTLFSDRSSSLLGLPIEKAFQMKWRNLSEHISAFSQADGESRIQFSLNEFTINLSKMEDDNGRLGKLLIAIPERRST